LLYNVDVRDYYGDELTENKMDLVYSCYESDEKYSNCKIFSLSTRKKENT